jgi:[DsrC]-trisulfide reductase subunit M
LPILAYFIYAAFWCRIILHARLWYKASKQLRSRSSIHRLAFSQSLGVYAGTALDIACFRRLLDVNGFLWFGSWTFHLSFLFVALRHLSYFLKPVPVCITDIQPFGVLAGYMLPMSLIYIFVVRIAGREKYVSRANFLILGLIFLISVTGLLLRSFRADLVDVKGFILGVLAFKPNMVPQSFLFIAHFILVLLLAPFLPFHIFTSPVTILEARRREVELKMVLHEK